MAKRLAQYDPEFRSLRTQEQRKVTRRENRIDFFKRSDQLCITPVFTMTPAAPVRIRCSAAW
jgi:hypothetical protein